MAETAELVIALRDEMSKQLAAMRGELDKYSKKAGEAATPTKTLADSMRSVGTSVKQALSDFALPLLALQAVGMGVQKALQSMQEGAKELQLGAAFKAIQADADAAIASMRAASQGLVTDTSLMVTANRWALAGKDLRELTAVMPAAQILAAATAQEVGAVAQQLASGLALGKREMLEQYVGLIDSTAAYQKYADAIGVSVKALSDSDKKMAISAVARERLNALVVKGAQDAFGTQAQQTMVRYQNILSEFEMGWARFVMRWVDGAEAIVNPFAKWEREEAATRQRLKERLDAMREETRLRTEAMHAARERAQLERRVSEAAEPLAAFFRAAADEASAMLEISNNRIAAEKASLDLQKQSAAALDTWVKSEQKKSADAKTYYDLTAERMKLEAQGLDNLNLLESRRLSAILAQLSAMEARGELSQWEALQLKGQAFADAMRAAWEKAKQAAREAADQAKRITPARGGGRAAAAAPAETAQPQGISAVDVLDLAVLRADRDERARVEAEYKKRLAEIDKEYVEAKITGTRRGLLEAEAEIVREQALARIAEQTARDRLASEVELAREILAQQELRGVVTGAQVERERLALDLRAGMIDRELYLERLRTIGLQEESDKRAEAQAELSRQIEEASRIAQSALAEYSAVVSNLASDERVDAQFQARMDAFGKAGALAAKTISQAMGMTSGAWQGTLVDMMQVAGTSVASFGADAREAAIIMAAFSAASAIVAAVTQQYDKAVGLGLAAVMYTVIAGTGGGIRSTAGRDTYSSISSEAKQAATAEGGLTINVNFNGQPVHTRSEIAQAVAESFHAVRYSPTIKIPSEAIG